MRFISTISTLFLVLLLNLPALAKQVTFESPDGLLVSADLNNAQSSTIIILFHQAGSSQGEYKTIAPRLSKLGYGTLAVDQRSGDSFGGVQNKTAKRARAKGKANNYLAARPDMEAAVSYAHTLDSVKRVVIWGSSYSAALSLVIAGQNTAKIDGVLAFSPGEYLRNTSVETAVKGIKVPTFLSSARSETSQWLPFHRAIHSSVKPVAFSPEGSGRHGSSALIKERSRNSEEYWQAVEQFLKKNF